MRIITYNFLLGGSATRDAWKSMGRLAPDILLAQECRMPPGPPSPGIWAEAAPGRWGTGIFLARGRIRRMDVPGFSGWISGGELAPRAWITERPLRVFSIHCPRGERGYVRTMHSILDALALLAAGADLVLGGDFTIP